MKRIIYTDLNTNMVTNETKNLAQQLEKFEMNTSLVGAANSCHSCVPSVASGKAERVKFVVEKN